MKLKGSVLWYDKKENQGVIQEDDGYQFFVSDSGLVDLAYLDVGDLVFFEKQCEETMQAINVVLQNPEEAEEECDHEFDSSEGGMCLNCGADGHDHFDEDYGQKR